MRGEFIDVGGARLYYYAAGTRGAGDPVVLLHGFPTSSRLWHLVARDFPDGHRLVVCDLLGFGRSDPPRGLPVTCAAHADRLLSLFDVLGLQRAAVVGHGMGGGVAQAFAVRHPTRVTRLGLVSSAAYGVQPTRMARVARLLAPMAPLLPAGLLAGLVHGSVLRGFADQDRSRLTLDNCLHPFTTAMGRDALAAHLQALAQCDTAEWTPKLEALGLPTAVIWGRHDPFCPVELGERIAAHIPGATLDVLPGAAHFVPEDASEQLTAVLMGLLDR